MLSKHDSIQQDHLEVITFNWPSESFGERYV